MSSRGKKRLGELLCEKAYLEESNLEVALAEQKVEYERLGTILVRLGYVSESQLNEALALQAGIDKVDLNDISIGKEITSLVPAEVVSKHNVLQSSLPSICAKKWGW